MTERATINEVTQLGVESTFGTAVPANKLLPSVTMAPSVKSSINTQRTQGVKAPTISAIGKEWSEWKISSDAPTYDELIYLLSSLLVTAGAPATVDTSGKKWTFTPSGTNPDAFTSFTAESGSSVRAAKAAGLQCLDLELTWDRDKVSLGGTLLGQAITDGITLTASPTSVAQVPMLAKDISIYADTTSGGLGGTKLLRALKGALKIGNRRGPVWANDKAQSSYVAVVELPITATLELFLEADAAGMAFLTKMRNNTRSFCRVDFLSDILAGASTAGYEASFDVASDVGNIGEFSDEQGVYGILWSLNVMYDATWGKWITTNVTSKIATL